MLDKECTNRGYLTGRLFAVLAKIQFQVNRTRSIKERYINSASINPAAVFPTILRLSASHQKNLKIQSKIFFEELINEIMDKLYRTIPVSLTIEEQASFFVGFYQQDSALSRLTEKLKEIEKPEKEAEGE